MPSDRRLGVGFLGAGNLNRLHHMPNVAGIGRARVEAVCDVDPQRLDSAARRFQPRLATQRYEDMLADPQVELVIIATAPPLQPDLVRQGLEAGKHVFVEKPMAQTAEQCLQLARLAEAKGRVLATGYNRRFAPAYRDVKRAVEAVNVPPMITYRLLDDTRDRPDWHEQPHLIDEVCHIFDLLSWLIDDEPTEVYCAQVPVQEYQLILRFAGGATGHILTGGRGNFAWPKERIEVVLDHAVVAVEDFVELRAANVSGLEHKCYAGREYEGWAHGYAERMASEGLAVDLALRKQIADVWQRDGLADMPPGGEREALRQRNFAGQVLPPVNYMVDKGWFAGMEYLIGALLADDEPDNAGGTDAARSIACAEAADESARTGRVVCLDRSSWQVGRE